MRLQRVAILMLAYAAGLLLAPMAGASPGSHDSAVGRGSVYRGVSTAVSFDVSPPLRSIPPLPIKPEKHTKKENRPSGLEGPLGPQSVDPIVQSWVGPGEIPPPLVSFDGPSNLAGVSPPDPVGDVGPNHYVAMSNLHFAVYSKTGTLLYGPAANNTLWASFGGPCQTENAGDPIVLHDQFADRWILTQFTAAGPTYYNCVAVSTTPDPTGTYYRYAFTTGSNFPDYPKYGIWWDALYISTREFAGASFAGVGAYAVNRAQLIAGRRSRWRSRPAPGARSSRQSSPASACATPSRRSSAPRTPSARKPDPAPYLEAARRLRERAPGLTPGECLAFEDSVPGLASALGAGMKVIGVTHSYPAAKLQAAHRVVESLVAVQPSSLRELFAD